MYSLIASLGLACVLSIASTSHPVEGVMIDKSTGSPVPFACFSFKQAKYHTDIKGEFKIKISDTTSTSLTVEQPGYEKQIFQIDPTEDFLIIYLTPTDSTGRSRQPINISQHLLEDFDTTYDSKPQLYYGYYEEVVLADSVRACQVEGRVEVYVPHLDSLDREEILVYPEAGLCQASRKFKAKYSLEGNAADMANSSLWREGSFLEVSQLEHYTFDAIGFNEKGEQVIRFNPKDPTAAHVSGHIFMDTASVAIVRIEYQPTSLYDGWQSIQWTECFKKDNAKYYLSQVVFKGQLSAKKKTLDYVATLKVDSVHSGISAPKKLRLFNKDYCFYDIADYNEIMPPDMSTTGDKAR